MRYLWVWFALTGMSLGCLTAVLSLFDLPLDWFGLVLAAGIGFSLTFLLATKVR